MQILYGYIGGIGYAFVCLLLSLLLYKIGMSKKFTRKIVHILVGFEWCVLNYFFGAGVYFLSVCLFFLILLSLAYKFRLMPMISSDDDNSPGTVYYAVAMSGVAIVACFVRGIMLPFGIAIFCTSIGDGLAGVVGQLVKKYNPKIYGNKTLFGTLTNVVASALCIVVMNCVFNMNLKAWHIAAITFFSVTLELVTGKGLDNISITWGVTTLTYGLIFYPNMPQFIIPILLSPWFISLAYKKKALTRGGIIMAVAFDLIISLALGNFGFTLLAVFFALAVLIDKFKKHVKSLKSVEDAEKGECRDYMQVIANGFLAAICALMYLISLEQIFIVAFAAAIAEALADTAASGIGVAANKTFDLFRFKKCTPGISGGMSLLGTFASIVAAYFAAIIGLIFGVLSFNEVMLVAFAGFVGAFLDSLLGSLVQEKLKCTKCGKITERALHCGKPAVHYSGLSFIDNDTVNMLSGFISVLFTVLIFNFCF